MKTREKDTEYTLLCTKSMLEIEEDKDIQKNIEEREKIEIKLDTLVDKEQCFMIKSYFIDKAHKERVPKYTLARNVEEINNIIECKDIKNGADYIHTNDTLAIMTHGQGYTMQNDETYHFVTGVSEIRRMNSEIDIAETAIETLGGKELWKSAEKINSDICIAKEQRQNNSLGINALPKVNNNMQKNSMKNLNINVSEKNTQPKATAKMKGQKER